ncbi:hypothetical protein AC249_AIPGENE3642 [Exaiptasia diaphana]|nr:hypothetical protein AC249_AIPGENE3642 [Exaiptasia diaphana]
MCGAFLFVKCGIFIAVCLANFATGPLEVEMCGAFLFVKCGIFIAVCLANFATGKNPLKSEITAQKYSRQFCHNFDASAHSGNRFAKMKSNLGPSKK